MKTITLISYHSWNSNRKAGFHWLANAFISRGYQILFVTAPISILSILYRDHRCHSITSKNEVTRITNQILVYPFFTIIHPESFLKIQFVKQNLLLSKVLKSIELFFFPFFLQYGRRIPNNLKTAVKNSDYIVFESTPGIMLFDEIRRITPKAITIYRISDDMELLGHHRIVKDYEKKILPLFDLVSVPSHHMKNKLAHIKNIRVHPHGLEKNQFEEDYAIPQQYLHFQKNLVFVGCSHFDTEFLKIASKLFPSYGFHIIGPIQIEVKTPNVIYYGEIPFQKTIPFIKHAHVGLQTRCSDSSVISLSTSLKVMQYTWCKLPILVPSEIGKEFSHFFPYLLDQKSIRDAIEEALLYNRDNIDRSWVMSWDEVAQNILADSEKVKKYQEDTILVKHQE